MKSIAQRARYHATMLLEPMTDVPLEGAHLRAFENNLRSRTGNIDTISDILFNEADALGIRRVCLEEIDRAPTPTKRIEQAISRLLALIPAGTIVAYNSAAYDDLHEELRSELYAIWRQRADGVHRLRPYTVAA